MSHTQTTPLPLSVRRSGANERRSTLDANDLRACFPGETARARLDRSAAPPRRSTNERETEGRKIATGTWTASLRFSRRWNPARTCHPHNRWVADALGLSEAPASHDMYDRCRGSSLRKSGHVSSCSDFSWQLRGEDKVVRSGVLKRDERRGARSAGRECGRQSAGSSLI